MLLNYEDLKLKCPDVSHETYFKFQEYLKLLEKWNKKINLVSKSLAEGSGICNHISDCLGLIEYIDKEVHPIADVGSGSGFPGIVLAIMGYKMILVEVNSKKSAFLREVIYRLNLNAEVVEKDVNSVIDTKAKVITSKAFSSISNIINYTRKMRALECRYLLLKNRNQLQEIEEIKSRSSFRLNVLKNKYNIEGVIIEIRTLLDE
jgi:16S rRNA (guanine(527)-N(7))-methyltransferase RsmG